MDKNYQKQLDPDIEQLYIQEADAIDFTLPNFNYMGPGTKTLHNFDSSYAPVNSTDKLALIHDLDYAIDPTPMGVLKADFDAILAAVTTKPDSFNDTLSRAAMVLGLGTKDLITYNPMVLGAKAVIEQQKPPTEKQLQYLGNVRNEALQWDGGIKPSHKGRMFEQPQVIKDPLLDPGIHKTGRIFENPRRAV